MIFFRTCSLLALTLSLIACNESGEYQALGTIERDRIIFKATASELIVDLPIAEGSVVHTGDLIIALDDRRQLAMVAKAKAELAKAAAFLQELRNGARIEDIDVAKANVEGADAALTVADKSFKRAHELYQKRLNAQSDLDKARAEKDSAKAALKSAQKHLLSLTNGTRKEELDQAEAALQALQAQLDLEQLKLSELSITATRDGYLDALPWNLGERVMAGATVGIMLADSAPFARVYIPEPWRAKVQVGSQLKINVDGVPSAIVGVVRWVANEPVFTPYYALNERDRARLMYLCEIDLPQGTQLPVGVPAQAHLITAAGR